MTLTFSDIRKMVSGYFSQLEEEELDLFLTICSYHSYKNKELIFKKGRKDHNLFLILKGATRSFERDKNGKETNHHLRSQGYVSGDARAFGDGKQMLEVQAMGEVHLLKFDVLKLEQLGYKNQKLLQFYHTLLKEIILTLSHRLYTFVSMSPKERYEDLIKWNPDYLDGTFDKHIASFLGVTPLTLHRIKKSM